MNKLKYKLKIKESLKEFNEELKNITVTEEEYEKEPYSPMCNRMVYVYRLMQKHGLRFEHLELDDEYDKELYEVAILNRMAKEYRENEDFKEELFYRMFSIWVEYWSNKEIGYLEDLMGDWDIKF